MHPQVVNFVFELMISEQMAQALPHFLLALVHWIASRRFRLTPGAHHADDAGRVEPFVAFSLVHAVAAIVHGYLGIEATLKIGGD
jgi:hypothetical protein